MIRDKLNVSGSQTEPERMIIDPEARYKMGSSQKLPVHIPTFLQRNNGDPAVKVRRLIAFRLFFLTSLVQNFLSKLRNHLLPRIQATLQRETDALRGPTCVTSAPDHTSPIILDETSHNFVFFKSDCIYRHKLLRFNFTTYDVRRGTDIIRPGTTRCNIMLLADLTDSGSPVPTSHHFLYARVLGAYHANVIYTGPGMRDYKARRFDFLWVRWYEVVDPGSSGWSNHALDSVRFPPLRDDDSFGFVDPIDILRGCHLLPAFSKGKRNKAGIDVSRCAKDSKDYELYYVGRYVQQCYDNSVVD
jgi:hypothetical protein